MSVHILEDHSDGFTCRQPPLLLYQAQIIWRVRIDMEGDVFFDMVLCAHDIMISCCKWSGKTQHTL